jgi:hypothetical protein
MEQAIDFMHDRDRSTALRLLGLAHATSDHEGRRYRLQLARHKTQPALSRNFSSECAIDIVVLFRVR